MSKQPKIPLELEQISAENRFALERLEEYLMKFKNIDGLVDKVIFIYLKHRLIETLDRLEEHYAK